MKNLPKLIYCHKLLLVSLKVLTETIYDMLTVTSCFHSEISSLEQPMKTVYSLYNSNFTILSCFTLEIVNISSYLISTYLIGLNQGPFGLAYFRAYVKQLMHINKLLCIIYKLVKLVYEKTTYEDAIFVSKNLKINIKPYLFAKAIFHKLKISSIQTRP